MDHFLKSLLNSLHYQFGFMFWFSDRRERGVSTHWPGIEPTPFALEGEVWTTGLPGKSLILFYVLFMISLRRKYPADESEEHIEMKNYFKRKKS